MTSLKPPREPTDKVVTSEAFDKPDIIVSEGDRPSLVCEGEESLAIDGVLSEDRERKYATKRNSRAGDHFGRIVVQKNVLRDRPCAMMQKCVLN